MRLDADTLKKFILEMDARTFAMYDLPVPGGPYSRTPFHGRRFPVKSWGKRCGRITASSSDPFASSSPATSRHDSDSDGSTSVPSSLCRISSCSLLSPASCLSRSSASILGGACELFPSTTLWSVSARSIILLHFLLTWSFRISLQI